MSAKPRAESDDAWDIVQVTTDGHVVPMGSADRWTATDAERFMSAGQWRRIRAPGETAE